MFLKKYVYIKYNISCNHTNKQTNNQLINKNLETIISEKEIMKIIKSIKLF